MGRNLPDGTVEVMAEGSRELLNQLLEFLHKGPSGAHVQNVDVQWGAASGEFADFDIRST